MFLVQSFCLLSHPSLKMAQHFDRNCGLQILSLRHEGPSDESLARGLFSPGPGWQWADGASKRPEHEGGNAISEKHGKAWKSWPGVVSFMYTVGFTRWPNSQKQSKR